MSTPCSRDHFAEFVSSPCGSMLIAILRRVGARVAAARMSNHSVDVSFHLPEQHAAALVRIGLFPVPANRVVVF